MDHGFMRSWILLLVMLANAMGCDVSRAIKPHDGAVQGSDTVTEPTTCDCSDATEVLSGFLLGHPLRFDYAFYGIVTTWGTHAEPVSPAEVVGLTLLLADYPLDCFEVSAWPYDQGLFFSDIKTLAGTSQTFRESWYRPTDQGIDVEADICLLSVTVQKGDPVGRVSPTITGSMPGCATLRFTMGDEPVGQASGHFAALRCLNMDSSYGE